MTAAETLLKHASASGSPLLRQTIEQVGVCVLVPAFYLSRFVLLIQEKGSMGTLKHDHFTSNLHAFDNARPQGNELIAAYCEIANLGMPGRDKAASQTIQFPQVRRIQTVHSCFALAHSENATPGDLIVIGCRCTHA